MYLSTLGWLVWCGTVDSYPVPSSEWFVLKSVSCFLFGLLYCTVTCFFVCHTVVTVHCCVSIVLWWFSFRLGQSLRQSSIQGPSFQSDYVCLLCRHVPSFIPVNVLNRQMGQKMYVPMYTQFATNFLHIVCHQRYIITWLKRYAYEINVRFSDHCTIVFHSFTISSTKFVL